MLLRRSPTKSPYEFPKDALCAALNRDNLSAMIYPTGRANQMRRLVLTAVVTAHQMVQGELVMRTAV